MNDTESEVTELLAAWSEGDQEALNEVMRLLEHDLREMARRLFAKESSNHTLQPTALVSELWMRLAAPRKVDWQNREHFLGAAVVIMRRILIDHSRRKGAGKRWGKALKVPLENVVLPEDARPRHVDELFEALDELARHDPRKRRIVVLQFFFGFRQEEIGEALGISVREVNRELQKAKAWLRRFIDDENPFVATCHESAA